ncbi:MAG: UDP-4-amino-4,6-dideoxy-N-acetyl-beta-L-altrosamine transaminase [Candidatus Thorarchaeota archaeon]|nr:UDP-4-amino-4,6-dideoxy-N-acetyl-beta-L-altrosamine transaminase [Candidatus Thorarchaeota archaeon]
MRIPYGKQWISEEDKQRVMEVLDSDFLTTGPFIDTFEKEFAKYVGAKYAIAVTSGTAALHLAAKALGVAPNTEVITTPMSFAATSNCVLYNSGSPVFSDITERGLLDPEQIPQHITERTVGIIPVHYMGLPVERTEISKIAHENDLFVIEDASHAIGAKYRDSKIGDNRYSDLTAFSLHPVKHITTGEGGVITTNDKEMNELLRSLRSHGITKDQRKFQTQHTEPWYQEMHQLGYNYRLTDIQAALGLSQLSRIDQFIKKRREIAGTYNDFFEKYSDKVEIIQERNYEFHAYHLYVIKVENAKMRLELFNFLKNRGIFCQVHYIPIYWHPYYRSSGYKDEFLPQTEAFYERIISLPMFPKLTDEEIQYVLESLQLFLK